MYKAKIIDKKSVDSVMNEVKLLSKLRHPFLVNMTYAFQDRDNLYLIMDYLNGGDLRYHIGKVRKFT
jgi:protein kinase A